MTLSLVLGKQVGAVCAGDLLPEQEMGCRINGCSKQAGTSFFAGRSGDEQNGENNEPRGWVEKLREGDSGRKQPASVAAGESPLRGHNLCRFVPSVKSTLHPS